MLWPHLNAQHHEGKGEVTVEENDRYLLFNHPEVLLYFWLK